MPVHWVHSKNFLFAAFLASIALGGVASFRRQQAMAMGSYASDITPTVPAPAASRPVLIIPNISEQPKLEQATTCAHCREACRQKLEFNDSPELPVRRRAHDRIEPELPEVCPMR